MSLIVLWTTWPRNEYEALLKCLRRYKLLVVGLFAKGWRSGFILRTGRTQQGGMDGRGLGWTRKSCLVLSRLRPFTGLPFWISRRNQTTSSVTQMKRFSIECCKGKTKVIILANHKGQTIQWTNPNSKKTENGPNCLGLMPIFPGTAFILGS